MVDVQGVPIKDQGAATVSLRLSDYEENNYPTNIEFRVGNVNDHVLSAGKVINRNTFRAILDADGSYVQRKDDASICVPLYLRRNSFYLKAKVGADQLSMVSTKATTQVAPLVQEEADMNDDDLPIDAQFGWE